MTDVTMDAVIELNNEAISLLHEGSHQKAILLLKTAIEKVKARLHSLHETASVLEQMDFGSGCLPVATAEEGPSLFHELNVECEFFICNRLFRLLPMEVECSRQLCIWVACIIYNMARVFQHIGMTTSPSEGRAQHFHKSYTLYTISLRSLRTTYEDSQKEVGDLGDELAVVFEIGAINNSIHFHLECAEFDDAKSKISALHRLLGYPRTQRGGSFSDEEVQGFLLNLYLLQHTMVAAAA